jgi:hypothetical protein
MNFRNVLRMREGRTEASQISWQINHKKADDNPAL